MNSVILMVNIKGVVTVTLMASVYHPLLHKQITLAVVEAGTEGTEGIGLFWTLFNEVLQNVSGNSNKNSNSLGWCTDMAGTNMAGICNVFGESAKCHIKSCKFYFTDRRSKKANMLDADSSDKFKILCRKLLKSVREKQFDNVKDDRLFLKKWYCGSITEEGFFFELSLQTMPLI